MIRLPKLLTLLMAILTIGALTLAPVSAQQVSAQSVASTELERENSDINKMFHKLGRGVVNVLTGWIEIPKQTAAEWRRTDPFTGTVLGVIKGSAFAVARTFVGFYEVISFPFPIPRDYQPLMEPEFVLPTVWGESLPTFRDEFVGTGASTTGSAVDFGSTSHSGTSARRTY